MGIATRLQCSCNKLRSLPSRMHTVACVCVYRLTNSSRYIPSIDDSRPVDWQSGLASAESSVYFTHTVYWLIINVIRSQYRNILRGRRYHFCYYYCRRCRHIYQCIRLQWLEGSATATRQCSSGLPTLCHQCVSIARGFAQVLSKFCLCRLSHTHTHPVCYVCVGKCARNNVSWRASRHGEPNYSWNALLLLLIITI